MLWSFLCSLFCCHRIELPGFRIAKIGSLASCQFDCECKFLYTTKSFMAFANKVNQKLNQRTDSTSSTWVDTIMNSKSQIPHRKTKLTRSNTKNCTIWGGIMILLFSSKLQQALESKLHSILACPCIQLKAWGCLHRG